LQDLQRNLDEYSRDGDPTLDNFAPGWRNAVDVRQSMSALRAALIEYWLGAIRSLGTHPATGIPLIVGEKPTTLLAGFREFKSARPETLESSAKSERTRCAFLRNGDG
jgi:hypothetical protein